MYKPIVWVARPNKTGWNGTRPRDLSDYSYAIDRETTGQDACLIVRDTYTDNPKARARKVVGKFYFDNHKQAKAAVKFALDAIENDASLTSKDDARRFLLSSMASMSKPSPSTVVVYTTTEKPSEEPVSTGYVSPEILEAIADVQEAVEPVFDPSTWNVGDPVPNGYIAIGKKLTKIGWPS